MNTLLSAIEPVVVPADAGPFVELGDHRGHILMSARSTDGAFLMFDLQVDPGGNVPPHIHRREEETFFIQDGRFVIEVGDERIEAGPGDTVFAPRDIIHTWRCVSPEGGRALLLVTPGDNFEAFGIAMAQFGCIPSEAMADSETAAEFMALT